MITFIHPNTRSRKKGSRRAKYTTNSLLKDHKKKFSVGTSKQSLNNTSELSEVALDSNETDDKIENTKTNQNSCLPNPPDLSHTNLPSWMQSYFQWHYQTRCNEDAEKYNSATKYLIVVCPKRANTCGGIADRLKPLPYYIHYANVTNRVLLFHWEKPSTIESFLIPSQLNFTVPSWLDVKNIPGVAQIGGTSSHNRHLHSNQKILSAKLQTWDAGRLFYDEHVGPPSFNEIFHDLFRSIFTPVQPLQELIDHTMTSLNLTDGKYVAVHVRARYPTSEIKTKDKGGLLFTDYKHQVTDWSMNAVNCAIQIYPDAPAIYFASDSSEAVNYMQYESPYVTSSHNIVSHNTSKDLLHVDISDYDKYEPHDFYPAFVDLYLIGNAKCVSFGMGGFGRFGQIMSYNYTCNVNHRKFNARVVRCPKPSFLK